MFMGAAIFISTEILKKCQSVEHVLRRPFSSHKFGHFFCSFVWCRVRKISNAVLFCAEKGNFLPWSELGNVLVMIWKSFITFEDRPFSSCVLVLLHMFLGTLHKNGFDQQIGWVMFVVKSLRK